MPAHPAVFVWPSRAVIFTVIFLLTSSSSTASTTSFTPFATSSTYSSKTATTAAKAKTATTTSTATLLLVRFHAPFSIFLCAIITTSLALRAHSHTSTTIQLKQTNDVYNLYHIILLGIDGDAALGAFLEVRGHAPTVASATSPLILVDAVLVRPARAVVGTLALSAGQLRPQPHAEEPEQAGCHR